MKKTQLSFLLIISLLLSSCSQLFVNKNSIDIDREPAGTPAETCKDLVERIISPKIKEPSPANSSKTPTVGKTLVKSRYLTAKDKVFVLRLPPVEWFNTVRKSILSHMKSRNKTKYPVFYLDYTKNYEKIGKSISELLDKQLKGNLSDNEEKLLTSIFSDIERFSNFEKDMTGIIDERNSLQWNIDYLKKLENDLGDEPIDQVVFIKKPTGEVRTVHTIRKADNNLPYIIDQYRKQLIAFNGQGLKPGIIEERVLRQALLKDIVTIYHREVEFVFKNTENPSEELSKLYSVLTEALKRTDFDPTTYGVFRIDNKVFKAEMLKFTGADKEIANSQTTKNKFTNLWYNYLLKNNSGVDPETMSTGSKVGLTLVNLTTIDFTNLNIVQVGVLGVAFLSAYKYFTVSPSTTNIEGTTGEVIPAPADGVDNSGQSGSSVQEIEDPQLNNTIKKKEGFVSEQYRIVQNFITKEFSLK